MIAWTTLNKLYGGVIGNSIFLLSLISVVAAIPFGDVMISSKATSLAILGAILLCGGQLIQKAAFPPLLERFVNQQEYYDYLCALEEKKSLHTVSEFSFLDEYRNVERLSYNIPVSVKEAKPNGCEAYETLLGRPTALLVMGELNYAIANQSKQGLRKTLTIIFVVGTPLLSTPAIIRVFKVFIEGVV